MLAELDALGRMTYSIMLEDDRPAPPPPPEGQRAGYRLDPQPAKGTGSSMRCPRCAGLLYDDDELGHCCADEACGWQQRYRA